jgi:hypothetical protein
MRKMKRLTLLCGVMICALLGAGIPEAFTQSSALAAQKRQSRKVATICGNPKMACETVFNFRPHDLPFRLPETAVIYDTEPFYAIILKSVRVVNNNCDTAFVPETERLQAQGLFPDHKVFASRCPESLEVFYTNVSPNQNFMAVYAGRTRSEAARVMAAVKATGQFPGANLRRLRAGINGT